MLYLIDNWINKGSGWIVESIESEYITDHYREATELKSSKKGLITSKIKMKNVSRQAYQFCKHTSRKNHKKDKEIANELDYDSVNFPVQKRI